MPEILNRCQHYFMLDRSKEEKSFCQKCRLDFYVFDIWIIPYKQIRRKKYVFILRSYLFAERKDF